MNRTRLASLAPALLGLAMSVVLFVDYQSATPLACAEGGGCEAAKRSVWASFGGVSTPTLGVLGFALLASLAIADGVLARRLHVVAAAIGAIFGAFFIVAQARIGRVCPYCMTADLASFVALATAWIAMRTPPPRLESGGRWGYGLLTLACGLVPLLALWGRVVVVPEALRAELSRHGPGQVVMIDFADFECPYCRLMHENVLEALKGHEHQVRLVRKHVPLMMHAHAPDAARAAICAEKMGQGDRMANDLFRAKTTDLTPSGTTKMAAAIGLDEGAFVKCLNDPSTEVVPVADRGLYTTIGGEGLPLLWVGYTRLEGLLPVADVRRVLESELSR